MKLRASRRNRPTATKPISYTRRADFISPPHEGGCHKGDRELSQQAIGLDPNFAIAYARLAEAYNQMPAYPYMSPQEAFPQAKAAAMRSLEIDPNLSEAHTAPANSLAAYDWN